MGRTKKDFEFEDFKTIIHNSMLSYIDNDTPVDIEEFNRITQDYDDKSFVRLPPDGKEFISKIVAYMNGAFYSTFLNANISYSVLKDYTDCDISTISRCFQYKDPRVDRDQPSYDVNRRALPFNFIEKIAVIGEFSPARLIFGNPDMKVEILKKYQVMFEHINSLSKQECMNIIAGLWKDPALSFKEHGISTNNDDMKLMMGRRCVDFCYDRGIFRMAIIPSGAMRHNNNNTLFGLYETPPVFSGKFYNMMRICLANNYISPDFFLLQDYTPYLEDSFVNKNGDTIKLRPIDKAILSVVLKTATTEDENRAIGYILGDKYEN